MLLLVWKMRTRKLLYPMEKVWVDKHKYDEAERIHYERQVTLAASADGTCQELVAVNGFCHDGQAAEAVKEDLWRVGTGKKQKKRKFSPKARSLHPSRDFVLAGLLADRVWFHKPLFDQAESAYHMKLSALWPQGSSVALPVAEPPGSTSGSTSGSAANFQAGVELFQNLSIMHCSHSSLLACHHVVQDVWVNKFNFDDAEKVFVERSQAVAHPPIPELPSLLPLGSTGQNTPDEGYVTALATPSTPAPTADATAHDSPLFGPLSPPEALNHSVNGKPSVSSLQALVSEVWLEKPLYDDAERCFYANLFDGHPPGKVRLQERGRPEPSKRYRKEKKGRNSTGNKRGKAANSSTFPRDVATSPVWCLMHPDSESWWFSKPRYDCAEAHFYACQASKLANEEATRTPEATLPSATQLVPRSSSVPEPNEKKMAANFLVHEKVWFDKFRYDDAEKRYYEQINGPAHRPPYQQENGASTILRDIARARENIQKSLAGCVSGSSSAGPAGDQSEVVTRITNLETENQHLRSVVTDLQVAITRLESRLSMLERASTSHHPSPPPPTQHVTPMKKVEPMVASLRKVVLPSALPDMKEEAPAGAAAAEEDDDLDLFGSDDEEEDQEAARIREERLKQYAEKKSKKPGLVAKSSILLDVKPWDDETDMAKMEEHVRSVQMDGLVWGSSKLVPVGYGIKKLQIQCVVEDDKVGTDILEEEITRFEDYVQSVDIAAFNKI